jgi:phosphatidylinositol alpha-mannosyltransferase
MRIALVSPYSWTYPGGVTRHIQALAEHFLAQGHDVKVLAPFDPPDGTATLTHKGAKPQRLEAPPYLIPLGRTVGFSANGAQSNCALGPTVQVRLIRELRRGNFDVVHVHEPVAPVVGWVAASVPGVPLVGTYHSYSTKPVPNYIANACGARAMQNHLHKRIAVSEAAAWSGRRWFGGRYQIVPNGVSIDAEALAARVNAPELPHRRAAAGEILDAAVPLKLLFIGQSVTRKGLPLLLRAFEALREHVPAELTVIGPNAEELAPLTMDDGAGIRVLGKVSDNVKQAELAAADVLVAPSLGGESFGMVLTEAMAAGVTVVASDIAGYRDVVTDGEDGILVPPGDAQALAETLRELFYEPRRRHALARAAAQSVQRYSWDRVAAEVLECYAEAMAIPVPDSTFEHLGVLVGAIPADLQPAVRARRLPSLEIDPVGASRRRWVAPVRRLAVLAFLVGVAFLVYKALKTIGITNITASLVNSSPTYVVLALVVMCLAMMSRAVSWWAILKAALPRAHVKLSDSMQGTMIGVLMSSTLPARLGEPARALVVARRTGKPREHVPVVLGTVVAQTFLNILALVILGVITFSSVNFFAGHEIDLVYVAIVPVVLLLVVLMAPIILRYGPGGSRFQRVHSAIESVHQALLRVRDGLAVFKDLKLGAQATFFQLLAWALQASSCYLLLVALGLSGRAGFAGAAAVLFAVNVTAAVPVTPSNLGVFQLACATVLTQGFHIHFATGIAYGVILQAVEVATAILLGTPSLLKEGMSWKEIRLRAMQTTPVHLPPRPEFPSAVAAAATAATSRRPRREVAPEPEPPVAPQHARL